MAIPCWYSWFRSCIIAFGLQKYDTVQENDDFLTQLRSKLQVNVIEEDDEKLVFDLIGVQAPIANALRRILLAEVPTMAIEHVFISDNTSVIPDEVLSHRIGLVPILADPSAFEMKTCKIRQCFDAVYISSFFINMMSVWFFGEFGNTCSGRGCNRFKHDSVQIRCGW